MIYNTAILASENKAFRVENIRQKQKRAQYRTIITEGGILTIGEGQDKITRRELDAQI